ncbi:hypothetical protein GCM10010240_66000 [Streptomyces griseoviridis]|nr:hypothetical protein GCM10010240_66000 [Streptomyces griseoviridis]
MPGPEVREAASEEPPPAGRPAPPAGGRDVTTTAAATHGAKCGQDSPQRQHRTARASPARPLEKQLNNAIARYGRVDLLRVGELGYVELVDLSRRSSPTCCRLRSPVMFFAVLQEGRWPPGPA